MSRSSAHVVFVAPFLAATTLRFVRAAAGLPGVRLSLISQDPGARLPADLKRILADYERVGDSLDATTMYRAVKALSGRQGPVVRLLGTLEQAQVALAEVRERLGIEGLGVEAAHNFRDKSLMKKTLRSAGVPCAHHARVETADSALVEARRLGYPIVAKPPAGAAAKNTLRVDDETALKQYLAAMPPRPASPLLLEEFVVGEEHSFDAVTIRGETVWHSLTRYRPGPLEVVEKPWIQWTVLLPREIDHPAYDDVRRVGVETLRALGMWTGLSHMEWFRRGDGSIAVSEVAARPPGAQFTSLISWAHDMDFYSAWARLTIFDRFDPPPQRWAAGIAYLRGQGQGRVVAVHGLERLQEQFGPLVVESRLPQPGQPAASSYEGEGHVVLRHPETGVVADALAAIVDQVRVEMA